MRKKVVVNNNGENLKSKPTYMTSRDMGSKKNHHIRSLTQNSGLELLKLCPGNSEHTTLKEQVGYRFPFHTKKTHVGSLTSLLLSRLSSVNSLLLDSNHKKIWTLGRI